MKAHPKHSRLGESGAPDDLPLASAIRAFRAERASPRQIEALARRLAPQFAAPPAGVTALPSFGATSKWVVSLVLAFGLSLFATLQLGRPAPRSVAPQARPTPEATAPVTPEAIASAPLPAAREPEAQLVTPLLQPRAARATRQLKARVPLQPRAAVSAPLERAARAGSNAAAELELLDRAQRVLESRPRAALALTEEHAATYPRGLFVQEREMLAIQALLELKQRRAALARAKAFLTDYPTSPHARHLRPLLEHGE